MFLALGIIIFVIGCCLSSYEDNSYNAERKAEQRHRELLKQLEEVRRKEVAPRRIKQTRRRIAKDFHGNIIAEEITEEEIDD